MISFQKLFDSMGDFPRENDAETANLPDQAFFSVIKNTHGLSSQNTHIPDLKLPPSRFSVEKTALGSLSAFAKKNTNPTIGADQDPPSSILSTIRAVK